MNPREIVTSKEFWIEKIANTLFEYASRTIFDAEILAKIIVNEQFMTVIKELAAQSSATDKAIIEKMGELIELLELPIREQGYIWGREKLRIEAELQSLKDKRDAT